MNYVISGKVVRGDGYGRKLGFPTINLDVIKKNTEAFPPCGVYAGLATLEGKEYRAGILINPTGKVEAHLIGYAGDAYDKMATLNTKKFLREFKKFEREEDLIMQIQEDLKKC